MDQPVRWLGALGCVYFASHLYVSVVNLQCLHGILSERCTVLQWNFWSEVCLVWCFVVGSSRIFCHRVLLGIVVVLKVLNLGSKQLPLTVLSLLGDKTSNFELVTVAHVM